MKKTVFLFFTIWLSAMIAYSQGQVIEGKVIDQNNTPVPGATISVKGTKYAVAASSDGVFKISASRGDILAISAVGYQATELKLGGGLYYTVTLSVATGELTSIVVTTALGIQREAKSLGYATASVSNKTLTEARSVNVQQALNGKVSGLNISTVNSGVMENAKINIRGIRSLTGNNSPMLVVDGAPTPLGYLSSIPPDDVKDVTILKSAASAAIYGPDAVNGVIVITTKRGGKIPTITLNTTLQASRVSFFPKLQKTFGDGAGEITDPYGNYGYVPYENQQFGPAFDGTIKPVGIKLEDESIQMLPYSNAHYKDKINFWNTGLTFQNSLSVAGEDFYVSIEDANIKGLVPDDVNRRTSFRFNGGKNVGRFSVNYGLNYILQNYDVVNEAGFQNALPSAYDGGLFFQVMQVASNVPLLSYKDWQNNKFAQFSNYYNEFSVNPYWLIGNVRTKGREDDILGSVDVSYQFAPWLKASARLSGNLAFQNTTNTNAPVVVSDWAINVAKRSAVQYSNRPGSVATDENYSSRVNLDYFLSGEHPITNDFSAKYIVGGAIRQDLAKDAAVGGNNLVVPYLYNVAVRSGDANVPLYPTGNYTIESRLLSAYGSVGFSYRGWANAEFTGRNDWDSRLLQQNRSFFYPGMNVSIVLSDAVQPLKNSNLISYVKLRGALSRSGNVNLTPYSLSATYSQPAGFPYGNNVGFSANSTIPSANLKPEFVDTKEAGIELGFLKNRINFSSTYFYQYNTNQILKISQSVMTGYAIGLANAADFKNYGVEMDLGLTPLIRIGKGRIDLKINATYNDNKVTQTFGNLPVVIGGSLSFIQNSTSSPTISNVAVVGRPAFAFQMTDYARDSATGKVIVDAVTGMPSQAGSPVILGRTLPLWIIGITPSFSIGGFSITMTWDYKGGHDFFSGLGSDEDFAGISAHSADYGRKRFVFPNSVYLSGGKYVPNTSIQVQDGNSNFWSSAINTSIATNYYSSAAAWRLRELNISYSLPKKWLGNQLMIKNVTLSLVGKNLLLIVPKSNQWGDPEFNYSTTGNTFGLASSFQSPASRLIGGSLTVQF